MSGGRGELKKHTDIVQSKIRSNITINSYHRCIEELIHNSLDSSASCVVIRVNVTSGFVLVVDNGCGITEKSMRVVGERYASSKCSPPCTKTAYGYRGETLASIAFLSEKLEIISQCGIAPTLCKTHSNGRWTLSTVPQHRPTSGTTVSVTKLFHHSCLQQSAKSSTKHMTEVVTRVQELSIIHCSRVAFTLKDERNGKVLVNTSRTKTIKDSVTSVFGLDYCRRLRPISGTHDQLQVNGVISALAYPSHKIRLISLNKRILRHNKLHQAVDRELNNSLINIVSSQPSPYQGGKKAAPQRRKFLYVITLRCDPTLYDVMNAADRTTVEFEAWQRMIDSVTKLVRRFLFINNLNKGVGELMGCDSLTNPLLMLSSSSVGSKRLSEEVVLYGSDVEVPERLGVKRGCIEEVPASSAKVRKQKDRFKAELSIDSSLSVVAEGLLDTAMPSLIGPPGAIPSLIGPPGAMPSLIGPPGAMPSPIGPPGATTCVSPGVLTADYFVSQWILSHFQANQPHFTPSSCNCQLSHSLGAGFSDYNKTFCQRNNLGSLARQWSPKVGQVSHRPMCTSSSGSIDNSCGRDASPGHSSSIRRPFNRISRNILGGHSKHERSLSPVPAYRSAERLSWSAPQPYRSSLEYYLTCLSPAQTHLPEGKTTTTHNNENCLLSTHRTPKSEGALPSYVTPVRRDTRYELVSNPSDFLSLTPDLQQIFAHMN